MRRYFLAACTLLLVCVSSQAQVKISATPGAPHASAIMELESTSRGFAPPRMITDQRSTISSRVAGLVVYNTQSSCLELYNGSSWGCVVAAANVLYGGDINSPHGSATVPFSNNTTCTTKVISATHTSGSCSGSVTTTQGNTYNVVLINGQCWMQTNLKDVPVNYTYNNAWLNNMNYSPDTARYGYYNTSTTNGSAGFQASEPAAGEGRLYQWNAAMNGSTAERSQGACPAGWHVPSDCEWKYLEHGLGMSIADQNATNMRSSGNVGSQLSTLTSSGTNSSGFTGLFAGYRNGFFGDFSLRNTRGFWLTSTGSTATTLVTRYVDNANTGVHREDSYPKNNAYSVRCLKD